MCLNRSLDARCAAFVCLLVAGFGAAGCSADEVGGLWGYEGETGPARWASLSDENVLCARGAMQSPVDLAGATKLVRAEVEREYGHSELNLDVHARVLDLIDNGHTIQVTSDAAVSMTVDDRVFSLVQFHFHAPSEHTINGERAPLEAHLVMVEDTGSLAVLGVLYEPGEVFPLFDTIISALPSKVGDERHLERLDLDFSESRPAGSAYYRYEGSLTTPPCTEGVTWFVVADRQSLGVGQIEQIVSHLHGNARPVQPLNERKLFLVQPDPKEK